jgi:hypothetical protein
MSDSALGQCDMVLSVSQDTINYQFAQLWKRGTVRNTWKVLVQEPPKGPPVVRTQEDAGFDAALQTWQTVQANIAALFADGDYVEFGKALAAATAAGELWDYGWTANVAAPVITIRSGDTQNLLFTVSFQSGTLLYSRDTTKYISTWELAGTVYSFRVPIGRLQITSTEKILTAEGKDQADKVIRESGLTESDFRIEALFLDFQNADIINFDATTSRFPADATTAIQITVANYFKLVVAGASNPFVLGYALNVKPVTGQEALFQPTSARFSTSYSTQAGCSAVNFLMMGGGRAFPAGQNVGVLPQSLLEGAGLGSTGDGVFGIDWALFNGLLIDPFVRAIATPVSTGFPVTNYTRTAQSWSLSATSSSTTNVSDPRSDFGKDTHLISDRGVSSTLALTNSRVGLQLECTVQYTVRITVQPWSILHWGYHTEFSASLSTSGGYRGGPQGNARIGSVTLMIQPGAQGTVNFSVPASNSPVLGYDSAPETGRIITGGGGAWVIVQSNYNHAGSDAMSQEALRASSNLGGTVGSAITAINGVIRSLNTGKVILPLGQLYTFANLRLRSVAQTDDNAVLMNVAYAPVIS